MLPELKFNKEDHPTVSANPDHICAHLVNKSREDLIEELFITATLLQNNRISMRKFFDELAGPIESIFADSPDLDAARAALLSGILQLSFQISGHEQQGGNHDHQDQGAAANN